MSYSGDDSMSSNNFKTDGSEVPRLRKSCWEVPENSEISTAKIKIFLFFALVEIARSGIVSICKQNNSKELRFTMVTNVKEDVLSSIPSLRRQYPYIATISG